MFHAIYDLRQLGENYPTRKTNVIPFFVPTDHKYETTHVVANLRSNEKYNLSILALYIYNRM